MSTLLLDIGNSRCKWGLWSEGAITRSGALAHEIVDDPARWKFASGVTRAIACNVAGPDAAIAIESVLQKVTNVQIELVRTSASHAGVSCAYPEPSRLGVDRWMAVLAVSRRQPQPAIVVDAGTAMTVDAIADGSRHLGGYIVPGFRLMQNTLMSGTADILVDAPEPPDTEFGESTSAAVRNGALAALQGTILRSITELASVTDASVSEQNVWFTGGDGALLAEAFEVPDQFEANLVLEGLAIHAGLMQ
ncbi:MAG: type III pantothenate kinase [Pseudomonadota bacterium]